MAVAGSLTYRTAIDTSGYNKGINDIKSSTESAVGQIRNIVAALGIDSLISSAMNTISSSVDSAMKRIDTMDQFNRVMTAMTGSAEEANKALDEIKDTVTGTAYGLDIASRSAQKFVTSGMSLDEATKQIKTWADAVAFYGDGTNETFENVTDALAKMVSKGTIEMEQLNRLTDAGIPAVQIYADSVGKSVSEVQDDLSNGVISSQEFMTGLTTAFNNGTKRFASITNAAKEAGASWSATFDNMKAAVTRGMQSIIESIDSGLEKSGMPSMRDMISDIGKTAERVMNKISKSIKKIDFSKVIKAIKNLVPLVEALVAGWVSYIAVMKAIKIASVVKSFISFSSTILSLVKDVKTLKDAMALLNLTFNSNPVGLIISGIVALGTLMVALGNNVDETTEKLKRQEEQVNNLRDSQEKMNNESMKTVSQGMSELSYYDNLYMQLQTLVDENGKVKEGYEDRVNFITNELKEGLGIEISLVDGVIQNYQELNQTMNEVVEKKKASITLNAQEEQYTEAIKNQADAYKDLNKYQQQVEDTQNKINKAQERYEALRKAGSQSWSQEDVKFVQSYKFRIKELNNQLDEEKRIYDKQSKVIEEYATDIAVYEGNLAKFRAGNYDEMTQYSSNYLANLKLTSNSELEIIQSQIDEEQNKLNFLKDMKKKNHTDIYNDQIQASKARLEELKTSFENEKNAITLGNGQNLQAWLLGLSSTLSALSGKQYEFEMLGNGTVQMYVNGVKKKEPIATDEIEKFGNKMIKKLNKKSQAKSSGENIIDGVADGVSNKKKQNNVFGIISGFADNITKAFNKALDINSPSGVFEYWSMFIPEGVASGVKKNAKKAIDAVDYMNNQLIDKVKKSVAIETGNINTNLKSKSISNNTIQINANFTGQVDMDGDRVGRIITPAISRTLKAGGLK